MFGIFFYFFVVVPFVCAEDNPLFWSIIFILCGLMLITAIIACVMNSNNENREQTERRNKNDFY